MEKVYVIGAGNMGEEYVRARMVVPESTKIIFVDTIADLPDGIKEATYLKPKPEITLEIKAIPRCTETYFPEKRKGHQRPYRFHR